MPIPTAAIADFCRKWQITELALFGSVLRDDFRPDSDVDLVTRHAVGRGPLEWRKKAILESLLPVDLAS